jgi:hypothetical protein
MPTELRIASLSTVDRSWFFAENGSIEGGISWSMAAGTHAGAKARRVKT